MVENYIMKDNLNYLFEWSRLNPSISENIAVDSEAATLTCKIDDKLETVYIGDLYLPTLLYNDMFRTSIANPKVINGKTLFKLIQIFRTTEDENKDVEIIPDAINTITVTNIDNQDYLLIKLNNNKKYKYKASNADNALEVYNSLKNKYGYVTLNMFGDALKNEK